VTFLKPARGFVLKKVALWTLAGLVMFAIAGFLILPPILKSVLTGKLSELLQREVTIQEIRVNPFALSARVTGFSIKDRGSSEPFVSFEELYLNLEAISLFKGGPVLSEILLKAPHATIIRNKDLTYNFSDLLEAFGAKPPDKPKPPPESKPLRFSLNNIQILDGGLDFKDLPKDTDHTVRNLTITIPFVSNLPSFVDIHVQPSFQATVNGTPVVLTGKTKPFRDSHETQLDIEMNGIDIPRYVEYIPVELKFKILSASLDSKLALSFIQYPDKGPALVVAGRVALNKLAITDLTERPLLRFPLLDVTIESVDVFAKKVSLTSVLLQSPEAHLWRDRSGILNLATLVPDVKDDNSSKAEQKGDGKSQKPEGPTASIEAAEIRLADGTITFTDHSLEKPFKSTVQPLNVTVHHFSNAPDKRTAVEVSLTTSAGETFTHKGDFTLQPLGAEGTVALHKVPVNRYAPYFPKTLLINVEGGVLDVSTRYTYRKAEGGDQTALSALAVTLSSVRLKKKGDKQEFFTVPVLSVKDTDIDVGSRKVAVGEFFTRQGMLNVTRASDGTLNLATLVESTPATEKAAPSAGPASGKTDAHSSPWVILLKKLAVDRYSVKVEDHVPTEPATLVVDPITLTAEHLSTEKGRAGTANLRLTLNRTGTLSLSGSLGLSPVSANLKVDAKGIDLIPLQPYFTDKVKIVVTSGALSTTGTFTLGAASTKETTIGFDGNATLMKLATVDKANAEDFVKWESLSVNGIHATTVPFRLEIKEIALTDLFTHVIVNPDGTLNLQGIVAGEKKASEEKTVADERPKDSSQQTREAQSIKIDTVRLEGGTISFTDRHITPNFASKLTQVGAKMSGLTSENDRPAEVEFKGKLDDSSPLEVTGKLNPLTKVLYADIKIDFKDMELSPLTPYSGQYAGYVIQKGKLSLNLKYLIDKRKLEAANKVFIDQFTFGERVDSPHATKLPVKLAVALLKDRKGAIRLDLPVAGSLDDPEFSVWGVILQVITNLLTKAATSPFALLGSLAGGAKS
jgi:uncharacterized protein involved in outer membrane biogenesis